MINFNSDKVMDFTEESFAIRGFSSDSFMMKGGREKPGVYKIRKILFSHTYGNKSRPAFKFMNELTLLNSYLGNRMPDSLRVFSDPTHLLFSMNYPLYMRYSMTVKGAYEFYAKNAPVVIGSLINYYFRGIWP